MRLVIQRVSNAHVTVADEIVGQIGAGLCVFLGIGKNDSEKNADSLAEKMSNLRIFEDDQGKMNRSVRDVGGEILVVSQFTLYGNAEKGRRPSFIDAARPELAIPLYERFVQLLRERGVPVETGEFGAMMDVELVNDGPVTLWLER